MATLTSGHIAHDRLFHYVVWSTQILLAGSFAAMALLKLVMPVDRLVEVMAWSASLPISLVRGLGAIELIGAIAVAAPAVTRTAQRVVGWTALSFLTLMASAAIVHLMRGEFRMIAVNVALGALAAFVAWGRLRHDPIEEPGAL